MHSNTSNSGDSSALITQHDVTSSQCIDDRYSSNRSRTCLLFIVSVLLNVLLFSLTLFLLFKFTNTREHYTSSKDQCQNDGNGIYIEKSNCSSHRKISVLEEDAYFNASICYISLPLTYTYLLSLMMARRSNSTRSNVADASRSACHLTVNTRQNNDRQLTWLTDVAREQPSTNGILIQHPGWYKVYSQIVIQGKTGKDTKHSILKMGNNSTEFTELVSREFHESRDTTNYQTSLLIFDFYLRKGDLISTHLSSISNLYRLRNVNYWGLFSI